MSSNKDQFPKTSGVQFAEPLNRLTLSDRRIDPMPQVASDLFFSAALSHLQRRLLRFVAAPSPVRGVSTSHGAGIGTAKGPSRKQNQDRALLAHVTYGSGRPRSLTVAVICDGMGGMADGEHAASLALSVFVSEVLLRVDLGPQHRLLHSVYAANAAVHRHLNGRGGTTLSAVLLEDGGEAWCAHVGDSRVYSLEPRANGDTGVMLLTRDDSISGLLAESEAHDDLDNGLLQFVGIGRAIQPHVFKLSPRESEFLVLTSDGAHGLPAETFYRTIARSPRTSEVVKKLLLVAEAAGPEDNASAISLCPRDFVREEAPEAGVHCTFWSPFDKLEAWIDLPLPASAREALVEAPKATAPTKKKKPKRKAATKASDRGLPLEDREDAQGDAVSVDVEVIPREEG